MRFADADIDAGSDRRPCRRDAASAARRRNRRRRRCGVVVVEAEGGVAGSGVADGAKPIPALHPDSGTAPVHCLPLLADGLGAEFARRRHAQ